MSAYKPWNKTGKSPPEKKVPLPIHGPMGPTSHSHYNLLLQQLRERRKDARPLCDECDADMTGQPVYDTILGWVCSICKELPVPEVPILEAKVG